MRDRDVRESVWRFLEIEHADDADTLMLDELGVLNGSTRIDIAVINGEITGFELKSERDTLERLPVQRDMYNMVLDRVGLVVAESHLQAALEIIPEWWGVWVAHPMSGGVVDVSCIRGAEFNQNLDPEMLCSFLWRSEGLEILERCGEVRGMKSKARELIYRRLAEVLDLDAIRFEVRRALKAREGWRSDKRSRQCDGLHQL